MQLRILRGNKATNGETIQRTQEHRSKVSCFETLQENQTQKGKRWRFQDSTVRIQFTISEENKRVTLHQKAQTRPECAKRLVQTPPLQLAEISCYFDGYGVGTVITVAATVFVYLTSDKWIPLYCSLYNGFNVNSYSLYVLAMAGGVTAEVQTVKLISKLLVINFVYFLIFPLGTQFWRLFDIHY